MRLHVHRAPACLSHSSANRPNPKVCEGESIGAVTQDLLGGLASLGDRWLEGGFSTMVSDVRQALVPKSAMAPPTEEAEEERGTTAAVRTEQGEEEGIYQDGFEEEEAAYQFDFIPAQELQRICCPITGLPMRDPVLAADGQAYERCVHVVSLGMDIHILASSIQLLTTKHTRASTTGAPSSGGSPWPTPLP